MNNNETLFFQNSWQHLMGGLDGVLEDARSNAASIREAHAGIEQLLTRAEQERAQAESALRALEENRSALIAILDEMQRELAVAGVPIRGEIS